METKFFTPVQDSRFMALVNELENCSKDTGCRGCPLLEKCRKAFDSLSDKATHYSITLAEYQTIKRRFADLHKQANFAFIGVHSKH